MGNLGTNQDWRRSVPTTIEPLNHSTFSIKSSAAPDGVYVKCLQENMI